MAKQKNIHIGTSGWHYKHWKGPFYREDENIGNFLKVYCQKFSTVEINNTFYNLPERKTLEQWKDITPDDFIFSIKASRYITHMKKLKDPKDPLKNFYKGIEPLKEKTGAVLFQLPPRWKINPERLNGFLDQLSRDYRHTFEFRDETWFDEKTYKTLENHPAAFCIYDLKQRTSPKKTTADFVYIRLHGPGKNAYEGEYQEKGLYEWAQYIKEWSGNGKVVYCYFDNDQNGYAPKDALRLKEMVTN
ncbi:MAG: DUF72 domain-containing protein [Balneolales bacterium]